MNIANDAEEYKMKILFGKGKHGTPRLGTALNIEVDGWNGLHSMLHAAFLEDRDPVTKDDSEWYSPVILKADANKRTLADIDHLSPFISLDLDKPGWSLERIQQTLWLSTYLVYTTTSSTPSHPHYRVVVMLDRPYSVAEHRSVWRYLDDLLDNEVDGNTKDASRISYMPAQWIGADNHFVSYLGLPLPVDACVQSCPIEPAPAPEIVALDTMPEGTELIPAWMIAKQQGRPRGGRLYALMCDAAGRHKYYGWELSANELAAAAKPIGRVLSPNDPRNNLEHEAQNAIDWASTNVATPTALQRIRDKEFRRLKRLKLTKATQ